MFVPRTSSSRLLGAVLTSIVTACVIASPSAAGAATLYVDVMLTANCSGTNYNIASRACNGSNGKGFSTFASAISAMQAGDTIAVRGGTYHQTINFTKSGTSSGHLRITNYNGETVIVDVGGISNANGITVGSQKYIDLVGLRVKNAAVYGLKASGATDITVTGSEFSNSYHSGLVFENGARITVTSTLIHHNNTGGLSSWHEAISFVNASDFQITNSQVYDNNKEGIVAKYGASNGAITGNQSYRNNGPNIYIDGASNIDVSRNICHETNAAKACIGLSIESTYNPSHYTTHDIDIFNNVLYGSDAGIWFWVETGDSWARFENIRIEYNTMVDNTQNSWGGVYFMNGGPQNFGGGNRIRNNIFWGNGGWGIRGSGSVVQLFSIDHNLFKSGEQSTSFGSSSVVTGTNPFVNSGAKDFHLTSGSPARNVGVPVSYIPSDFDGKTRPTSGSTDVGAFQYGGAPSDTTPPSAPTALATTVSGTTASLTWNASSDNVGVVRYNVHRSTTNGFTPTTSNRVAQVTGTSHQNTGLAPGTHYYRVIAEDAAGNLSASSNQATAVITSDTTAPVLSNGQPTGTQPVGTTQATLMLTSNEAATCRYSTTANVSYASKPNTFGSTGATLHTTTVTGLANGGNYTYYVRCQDAAGNANTADYNIAFSVAMPAGDTTPPVRSNGAPSGTLPGGTTSTNLSLQTNEAATCRYSTTANIAFTSMTATFSTTGGTTHSTSVSGLTNGSSYTYYVRCRDLANNANTNDFNISFSVGLPPQGGPPELLAGYAFNATSGSTATDASGNGKHGTVFGSTWSTQGKFAGALSFDGVDDRVTTPSLDLPAAFTLMAWVFNPSNSSYETLMTVGSSRDLYLASGTIRFWDGGGEHTFGSALSTNTWHHVAFVSDGSTVRAYLNGASQGSAPSLLGPVSGVLGVGAVTDGGDTWDFFAGRIDDARVYSRALTQSEIQATMNTPVGAPPPPSDTTPPGLGSASPTGTLPVGTTQATLTLTSNEAATCRYSTTANTSYGSMPNTFASTGGTTHSTTVTGLTNGTSYTYYVRCQDAAGNANTADYAIAFSVAMPAGDTTPPVRSAGAPSGTLPAGTTAATLSLQTNESSSCKYGTTANTAYTSLPTTFGTTGGTTHSTSVSGLTNGTTYTYYVRCRDLAGNVNTNDFSISFSVAASGPTGPSGLMVGYAFNATSGTTATDASGNGKHGTVSGATWSTQGRYAGALSFDGVNDSVNGPSVSLPASFTLMAWVFNPANDQFETLLNVGVSRDLYLAGGVVRFWDGSAERTFGSALSTNTWHHVAIVSNGSTVRAYVNGAAQGSTVTVSLPALTDALRVGSVVDGVSSSPYDFLSGRLDDVRVYNRALTQTEVQTSMNAALP